MVAMSLLIGNEIGTPKVPGVPQLPPINNDEPFNICRSHSYFLRRPKLGLHVRSDQSENVSSESYNTTSGLCIELFDMNMPPNFQRGTVRLIFLLLVFFSRRTPIRTLTFYSRLGWRCEERGRTHTRCNRPYGSISVLSQQCSSICHFKSVD